MKEFLWFGPAFEGIRDGGPAVSYAALRWQRGLTDALKASGTPVRAIGYVPHPSWPRGRARVHLGRASDSDAAEVAYVNMPVVREFSIGRALLRGAEEHLKSAARVSGIVTYNVARRVTWAAEHLRRRHGIPWVAILADLPEGIQKRRQLAALGRADGVVYLSWAAFTNARTRRRLHLDCGVDALPERPEREIDPGLVLYSGALNEFGGLGLLLQTMRVLGSQGAKLIVTGKNPPRALLDEAERNESIRYAGALPDEELRRLSERAAVFVNPRPAEAGASYWNFPSKVVEYLSYGKPTVSTWTPGLAPEFRNVLLIPEAADAIGLAAAIRSALGMGSNERAALRQRICAFLREGRTWHVQGQRFSRWAAQIGQG